MLLNADIYVKDVPGQLVSALEPLSSLKANIIGVVHSREQMVSGRIAVNLTFDIDAELIEKLKNIWVSRDVTVASIGSVVKLHTLQFMVIGDVTADTMKKVFEDVKENVDVESSDFRIVGGTSGKNTSMVKVSVKSDEDLNKLEKHVSEYCKANGCLFISGVE